MAAVDFEKDLNPEQLEGVVSTEGPVLVLAGAGSGKTRVLTYKIAYLVHVLGIDPGSIFAVTFTNKAAGEMRERAQRLLERNLKGMWIGTFHSLCGRMLRRDADAAGIQRDFIIYDADDSVHLLREIISDMGLDTNIVVPKRVAEAISNLKRRLKTASDFSATAQTPAEKTLAKIYARYDELLRKANALDFDDLIMFAVRMLILSDKVRRKYSEMFQYILVDEFQDTNESQFVLLRKLTELHQNITAVGDDDQSIYSWRGARIKNILEFPKFYPNCKIIKLERNYRSTGNILAAASSVIAHNTMRHKKRLYTDAPDGEKVLVAKLSDDYSEARFVVDEIERLTSEGTPPGQIAVLYRINALSRLFEEELRRRNIPYVVVGGVGFYERAEIKDALAYLRLIVNPADDVSFKRVVNKPRRGVGIKTIEKLEKIASDADMSLLELVESGVPLPVQRRALEGLRAFAELIASFRAQANTAPPSAIVSEVLRQSGYIQMLISEGTLDAQSRLENIGQLVEAAHQFENQNPNPTLQSFLATVTLMTDVDRWTRSDETVNLMTVHAAKGLEFDAVFVVGLELGIFPILRALSSDEELEEERRLFYVALTRAKRFAAVTHVLQRSRFGSVEAMAPSPFVAEIDEKTAKRVDLSAKSLSPRAANVPELAPGRRVVHPFFGEGVVVAVRGRGERAVVTVEFAGGVRKKLVLGFAKLKPV